MLGGWPTLAATTADCELVHGGWPDQPVNAWSSMAFVAVGVALFMISKDRAGRLAGIASVLTGAGSLVFHGGRGPVTDWLHDWSIAVLLLALLAALIPTAPLLVWVAASAALGALFAAVGGVAEPVSIGLSVVVGLLVFRRRHRVRPRPLAFGAMVAAAGVSFTALGRTGGPLCDPASPWQPHALWHVMAAAAVLLCGSALGWFESKPPPDGGQ